MILCVLCRYMTNLENFSTYREAEAKRDPDKVSSSLLWQTIHTYLIYPLSKNYTLLAMLARVKIEI